MLKSGLPWDVLVAARGWCRMRAGLTLLTARHGRASAAQYQDCIFCGRPVEEGRGKYAAIHCLGQCPFWTARRKDFVNEVQHVGTLGLRDTAMATLRVQPQQPGFVAAVLWLDAVDAEASQWWHRADSPT